MNSKEKDAAEIENEMEEIQEQLEDILEGENLKTGEEEQEEQEDGRVQDS